MYTICNHHNTLDFFCENCTKTSDIRTGQLNNYFIHRTNDFYFHII